MKTYILMLDGVEMGTVNTKEEAENYCASYDGDHDPSYEEKDNGDPQITPAQLEHLKELLGAVENYCTEQKISLLVATSGGNAPIYALNAPNGFDVTDDSYDTHPDELQCVNDTLLACSLDVCYDYIKLN